MQRAVPLVQSFIAYGSITSDYQLVGDLFGEPCLQLIVVSTMDDTVQFSWDGVNDAFPVVAKATIIIDVGSNGLAESANQGAYVKLIGSPSTGGLYIGGFTV